MWFRQVEIPNELVSAARDGKLVIFVGAGASRDEPAALPGFTQLVKDIGTQAEMVPTERQLEQPDLFLGDLDDMEIDVHTLVAKAIDPPGSAPNRLHHAIMSLATAHPPLRVVTTNYDQHLEVAARIDGLDVEVYRAPALPIGDDFSGVVHLHGVLGQDPRHLVVTDTDFGHAYLREAWAARFLDRMFSEYTILFVGYSHNDVVMQYLARSLGREGSRFVLTNDAASRHWSRLGLTAVSYPVVENSHVSLAESLERWAELSVWGRLDHRRRIAELVGQGPPSIPEEVSYLEQALSHPEHVRFFAEAAHSADWLQWTATRPEFSLLFAEAGSSTAQMESISATLTWWFIDGFACVEEYSPVALRLVRDRPWTDQTWEALVQRLATQRLPIADWQVPWLIAALYRAPHGRHRLLDMMLASNLCQDHNELAFTLLEHRTTPILRSGVDFGSSDQAPRFEVTLAGEEHWLTEAWGSVYTPMLSDHAHLLLDLAVRQIQMTYRLARLLQPGFDHIGFARSAIESHPQDEFREPHDVLIDAARDSLEHLMESQPQLVAWRISSLEAAHEAVLRRLAVHCWRLRTDVDADAKLNWTIDNGLLYNSDLQHEVYLLLRDVLLSTSSDTRERLLAAANSGPASAAGAAAPSYARYNLFVWLHRAFPAEQRIAEEFNAAQESHPDFRPREHPDLNMYSTSGIVEDAEPFSPDELHAVITENPRAALAQLRHFATSDEFRLTGPTWNGALSAVQGCVKRFPLDGFSLADHFLDDDEDLRRAVIRGWSGATLPTGADHELADQVISLIGTWDLGSVRSQASSLLASGEQAEHPTRWHDLSSAWGLARRLWPHAEMTGNVVSDSDTFLEALNHPAGDLARFWTKVVAAEWRRQGDKWAGLPPLIREELDRMIGQPGRNGLLARCILVTELRFYHGAHPEWACERLLPLLSWTSGATEQVAAMWRAFLSHGQFDSSLLRAGLLDLFLATLERGQDVDDDRLMESLGRHLAAIALRFDEPPTSWLPQLTVKAPAAVRLAWMRFVGRELRAAEPNEAHAQWERWIEAYWRGRVSSIPRPFSRPEASAAASWVLGLPTVRGEAVNLVEQMPAGLERDGHVLVALGDLDVSTDALVWIRYLTHLLQETTDTEPWAICHYLAEIVPTLRAASSEEAVSPLIEQALRFGCSRAPEW